MAYQMVTASRGSQGQLNIAPTPAPRRPNARGPRVVSKKVAALMGLADYSSIDSTTGARVSYGGTQSGTTGTSAAPYPDGTLIQGAGQAATYLMQGGQAHWIPDFATFTAMGFQTSEITRNVPLTVLNPLIGSPLPTLAAPVSQATSSGPAYPDGTLLQGVGQSAVYLVQGGLAHWIPDWSTFAAMGFQTSEITRNVPLTVLNAMVGAPLPTLATPVSQSTSSASTSTSTSQAGTVAATLEAGASYDSTNGYWVNPDGSIYYPQTSAGNYIAPGSMFSTISAPAAATAVAPAFDITSPSTWPTWVWLALAAGGTWLVLFKKK